MQQKPKRKARGSPTELPRFPSAALSAAWRGKGRRGVKRASPAPKMLRWPLAARRELGQEGSRAAAAGPLDYAPGAFLAFLHNLSPAEEPVACVPPGHRHLPIAAPRAATAAAAPPVPALAVLSHSANTQPNPGPAAHPFVSPVGEKKERAGQLQRPAGTPDPPGGCRSSTSTTGRERRKRRRRRIAGEARGWGTGRGGAWTYAARQEGRTGQSRVGRTGRSAGLRGASARPRGSRGVGGRGGGKIWGGRDGQTAPKAGEGGRLGVLGGAGRRARRAGAGKPPGRRPAGLGVALQLGAGGALDPKRPRWGGVTRDV